MVQQSVQQTLQQALNPRRVVRRLGYILSRRSEHTEWAQVQQAKDDKDVRPT